MMCMLNTHVQQIQANHRMALCGTPDGKVFSLGRDFRTLQSTDERTFGVPRLFEMPVAVSQMSVGANHAVLLASNGQVFTFGSNQWGQLGVGSKHAKQHAAPVLAPEPVPQIDSDVSDEQPSPKRKSKRPKQQELEPKCHFELESFTNPVTTEQFEFAATPIPITVVQSANGAVRDRVKRVLCGENHTLAMTE